MTTEPRLFDDRAERAVLGGIIIDPSAYYDVGHFLLPRHFYSQRNRRIYEAMQAVAGRGEPIDTIVLNDELSGEKEDYYSYITDLLNIVPTSVNTMSYGRVVEGYAIRRDLIKAAGEAAKQAYDLAADVQDVLRVAEKSIFDVGQHRLGDSAQNARAAVAAYLDGLVNEQAAAGIPTGFMDLDPIIGGWRAGSYYLLAARPGMGKSAMALQTALYAAALGKRTLFFTLEMTSAELVERAISNWGRVDSKTLRDRTYSAEERQRINETAANISKLPLVIDDSARLTPMTLRAKAMRHKAMTGLDLLVVDHVHIMDVDGRFQNDNAKHEYISRELKKLSKELDCPVLALAQLNRSVESRNDKIPSLSDLRASGGYEQDANVVMFLYRDDYYNELARPGEADVIIAKNRGGNTGRMTLVWQGKYTWFGDMVKQPQPVILSGNGHGGRQRGR